MCKDDLLTLFCKMFIVSYSVKIVYICVLTTCSTSYCLCDTLMDPWNIQIYMCARACTHVCVCVCVCVYVCMHACKHDRSEMISKCG